MTWMVDGSNKENNPEMIENKRWLTNSLSDSQNNIGK